mmetsp:Transcript_6658/g.13522  ORF Transcript_6658/g.13522 Transcript_6658/m.13522 type:complete len:159 (+) Transcript_6658:2134-2610(+)
MLKKLSLQLLVYIARWSPDGMELLTSSHASVLPRLILLLDEEICKIRRIVAPIIFEGDLYNLPQEAGSTDACHPPETSSSVILISEAFELLLLFFEDPADEEILSVSLRSVLCQLNHTLQVLSSPTWTSSSSTLQRHQPHASRLVELLRSKTPPDSQI